MAGATDVARTVEQYGVDVDAHAYLRHAVNAALTTPEAMTLPDVRVTTA